MPIAYNKGLNAGHVRGIGYTARKGYSKLDSSERQRQHTSIFEYAINAPSIIALKMSFVGARVTHRPPQQQQQQQTASQRGQSRVSTGG